MAKELKFNATVSDDKVLDTLMKIKASASETDTEMDKIKKSTDAATESFNKLGEAAKKAGDEVKQTSEKISNMPEVNNGLGQTQRRSRATGGTNVRKDDILYGNVGSETAQQFINKNRSLLSFMKDEETVLKSLQKEWSNYNELVKSGADQAQITESENRVYKWAKSYEALGKNVDAVSPKIKDLVNNSTMNNGTKNQFDVKGFQALAKALKIVEENARAAKQAEQEASKTPTFGIDQESIDKMTTSLVNAVEKMNELKSGSTSGGFSEEQFTRMATAFESIESHLREMKAVISDVGEGKRFSPLMGELDSLVNKVDTLREKMNVLKDTMSNIKLNMDIGSAATDNQANKLFEKNAQRRYAANKDLFEKIWSSGKLTPQTANYQKYLPEEKSDVEQLTAAYEKLIKITEERYGKKNLQNAFPEEYKEVKNAAAAWNSSNRKLAESTASFKEMFKPDMSGFESAVTELKKEMLEIVASSTKISEAFNVSGDGLALEKTLQAIKSISIEIVKYLSEINSKILSSADSEAVLAAKAKEAATAISEQAVSAKEIAAQNNKAITDKLMKEFNLSKSAAVDISEAVAKMQEGSSSIDGVLQVIVDKMGEAAVKTGTFAEEYKKVRDYISSTGSKIHISPDFKSEFGDDWNRIRSTIGTKVMTTTGGSDAENFVKELNQDLGNILPECNSAIEAIQALYDYLNKNNPKNLSGKGLFNIEDIRDQAKAAIAEALGLVDAEEKVKLSAAQAKEQQTQLNAALKESGFEKYSSAISSNGKVMIDILENEAGEVRKVSVEYKNLETAMNAINNGTLLSGKGRASGSTDEEAYVKRLTSAINDENRAQLELEKAKKNGASEQQLNILQENIDYLGKNTRAIMDEVVAYGALEKQMELLKQAELKSYQQTGAKKNFLTNKVNYSTEKDFSASYASAMQEVKNIQSATNKFTPDGIQRVNEKAQELISTLKKLGVVINADSADFSGVSLGMAAKVEATIKQLSQLPSSMTKTDLVSTGEDAYLKKLTKAYEDQAKALKIVNDAKLKHESAEDIATYGKRVNAIAEEIKVLKEEAAAYGLSNTRLKELNAEAKNTAYQNVGYKNNATKYKTVDAEQVQRLSAVYAEAESRAKQLSESTSIYRTEGIDALISKVNDLKVQIAKCGVEFTDTGADFSKVTNNDIEKLDSLIKKLNELKIAESEKIYAKSGKSIGTLGSNVNTGTEEYFAQLKSATASALQMNEANIAWAKSGNTLIGTFRNQEKELQKVTVSATEAGKAIRMSVSDVKEMSAAEKWLSPLTNKLKELSVYFSSFTIMMGMINAVKEGVSSIVELNQAITENQVVTGSSNEELKQFTATAKEAAASVASTTTDLVQSATDWSRLGYSASDALQLAKQSAELAKVGFMDVDDATSSLTASLQGFYAGTDQPVERAQELIDKFVEIGNTMPISSEEIAQGLADAGGVLNQAGKLIA